MKANVRFALQMDMALCQQMDLCKDPVMLSRKISAQEIILAEIKGKVVGYLSIQYLGSVLPYITLIKVKHPFQCQGIGKEMLSYTEQHLIESKNKLLLSSCQADELEPQDWHRAQGFRECGMLQGINPGGVDEIFFCKELT